MTIDLNKTTQSFTGTAYKLEAEEKSKTLRAGSGGGGIGNIDSSIKIVKIESGEPNEQGCCAYLTSLLSSFCKCISDFFSWLFCCSRSTSSAAVTAPGQQHVGIPLETVERHINGFFSFLPNLYADYPVMKAVFFLQFQDANARWQISDRHSMNVAFRQDPDKEVLDKIRQALLKSCNVSPTDFAITVICSGEERIESGKESMKSDPEGGKSMTMKIKIESTKLPTSMITFCFDKAYTTEDLVLERLTVYQDISWDQLDKTESGISDQRQLEIFQAARQALKPTDFALSAEENVVS